MGHRHDKEWLFALARGMRKVEHTQGISPAETSPQKTEVDVPLEAPNIGTVELSPIERVFKFLENSLTLLAMGVIGGIIAAVFNGKWLVLWLFPIGLGLHRSEALRGYSLKGVLLAYVAVLSLTGLGLWKLGLAVGEASAPFRDELANLGIFLKNWKQPSPATPNPTPVPNQEVSHPPAIGEELEILDFNSDNSITLQNHSSDLVTVIGVTSTLMIPFVSVSVNDMAEIKGHESKRITFAEFSGNFKASTVKPMAETFQGQVEAANREYKGCVQPLFLFPSGVPLKQVTDAVKDIPLGDGKSEIRYKIRNETRVKSFSVKVIVMHADGCMPQS